MCIFASLSCFQVMFPHNEKFSKLVYAALLLKENGNNRTAYRESHLRMIVTQMAFKRRLGRAPHFICVQILQFRLHLAVVNGVNLQRRFCLNNRA